MAAEGSAPRAHASGGLGAPTALQRLAAFTQGVRQHMQQPGSSLPAHLRQDAPRPAPVELPEEAFMEGNPDLFRNLCLAAGVRDRARCSVDVYGATHAGADFEELRSRQDAQHLQKQAARAAAWLREGKVDSALRVTEAVLQVAPEHVDALVIQGAALARRGDVAGAARDLRAALALQPSHADAQAYLAKVTAPPA